MKTWWKVLVLIGAGLGGGLLLREGFAQPAIPPAAAAPTRVAVCDIGQVFNNNERSKSLRDVLDGRRKAVEQENEKRGKAIEAAQLELGAYKEGSAQYEKTLADIQRLTIDRKVWLEFQNAMVIREHQRLTREMYDQILKIIEELAVQRGLDVVLYVEREMTESDSTRELVGMIERRKVLYARQGTDITEAVLTRLNQAYRAATAPAGRPG